MNLPNTLTLLRLIMVPLFSGLFRSGAYIWALVIFLLAAATDALDGFLARRLHQITNFGKLADPLADKLMTLTMLYNLCHAGYVPTWILVVMAAKELFMVVGGSFLVSRRNVVPYSTWAGKVTTVTFIISIVFVYPWHEYHMLRRVGGVLMTVAVGFALFALVSYILQYIKYRKKPVEPVKED